MSILIVKNKAFLSELAALIDLRIDGEDVIIDTLNLANRQTKYNSMLSYTTGLEFCKKILNNLSVKALIVNSVDFKIIRDYFQSHSRNLSYIIAENAEYAFYDLHNKLWENTDFYDKYEWPYKVGKNCKIAPSAVVEDGVIIGDNVVIGHNSVLCGGTVVEDNVIIGCNCTIGSDGFQAIIGYRKPIKHIGSTIIHKGVQIHDSVTIARSLFEDSTEIGSYTQISNHVHFAHNSKCGEDCVICASTTMFGSVTIGDRVWIAPNCAILNKVVIENDAFVGAMSFVNRNVSAGTTVVGIPAKKFPKD